MRVLVCGEGSHDVGVSDHWDARRGRYVSLDGWMQPLLRRAISDAPTFSVRKRADLQLLPRDPDQRRLPRGHGAKAFLAKRAAVTGGFDVLIFMVDADSNRAAHWRRIVGEISAGFRALNADVCCVACVPMAASESWLLSDAEAWATVANYDGADLPQRPESIWGVRDNPSGDHPHQYFARICDAANMTDNRETRVHIAEAMSLAHARARCPVSLDSFLVALRF